MSAPLVRKREHVNTQQNPFNFIYMIHAPLTMAITLLCGVEHTLNSYLSAGEANLFKI